jgi:hypothetical protein
MTGLVASDLTVAVAFGAAGAILVALTTLIVGLIIDAIGEGDALLAPPRRATPERPPRARPARQSARTP